MSDRFTSAWADLRSSLSHWRLWVTLAWLDLRLRYRGSLLGPFWTTLSTAVLVLGIGVLYSRLFRMDLKVYLPFVAVSLVLWNYIATIVNEACTTFTRNEATIKSIRLPSAGYALRTVATAVITFLHSAVVVVALFLILGVWPGPVAALSLVGIALWILVSFALCLLLGALSARFRDIPPIVASVVQFAFFLTPVIWNPETLGDSQVYLYLNPFYPLLEVVRGPLLGTPPSATLWAMAVAISTVLTLGAFYVFARVRGRISYWI